MNGLDYDYRDYLTGRPLHEFRKPIDKRRLRKIPLLRESLKSSYFTKSINMEWRYVAFFDLIQSDFQNVSLSMELSNPCGFLKTWFFSNSCNLIAIMWFPRSNDPLNSMTQWSRFPVIRVQLTCIMLDPYCRVYNDND
jgi:hypothetical protein